MLTTISTTFIGQEIGVLNSEADLRMAAIGSNRKGRRIPLEHHIFEHEEWVRRKCAPQPTCMLTAKPCPKDHEDFGHTVHNKDALRPVEEPVVADSGCQSTAVPPSFAYSAGFKRRDFIPVKSNMNGAGGSHLGVVGAVVMEFASRDGLNNILSTRQLCYVCEKVSRVYLSRQGCIDLGMLDSDFPSPKHRMNHEAAVTDEDPCPCSCPARSTIPPPLPTAVPADISVADDQAPGLLKQWLLDHYASTVFNTCEHQKLPMMTGTPLQLHVDPAAKPVACHKVTPVPLHWKYKVKADLDRDVALGVLEKVPDNTPVDWLSRMVITAKSNGDPRRTIDYQPLNKHSRRQTFPVQSPFQLACQIPPNMKKTVVDAWNGYHSVSLNPDDRHYTTFLTEWGRYRYLVSAQGHLVSGDGYNERLDAITSEFRDHVRCVDDTAMWAPDISTHFLQVSKFLDLCARNGIILNKEKFQFCQDTVLFAGLKVSKSSVMPSDKLLDSIKNFPVPKDISGARAWFGLVNQGAYAFAMTEEMAPFRHLLKPKTKFEWTEELDRAFQLSKENIVNKIKQGVELFDINLPTCLATDFSITGIGFFLLQKTCACQSRVPTCCADGWRLCLVGSRFLHDAETRYAPIEGEALAVAYALHQCRYFIQGCKDLTVVTDHLPLLHILNDRSLADIGNRRLQNLKEKTLSYQFSIAHVPGRKQLGADAASRYPVGDPERLILPGEPPETDFQDTPLTSNLRAMLLAGLTCEDMLTDDAVTGDSDMEEMLLCSAVHTLGTMEMTTVEYDMTSEEAMMCGATLVKNVISWADVRASSSKDATIQSVLHTLQDGFPDDARPLAHDIRPFFPMKHALYELDGVLMLGDRIVVPADLRPHVLSLLHAAHQGVDRMKARATDTVYWPGLIGDISRTRAGCTACHKMAKSNPTQPPTPPEDPQYPFQQLAADYFHYGGHYYAVIVDRYSHWPVVFRAEQDSTGSKGLISHLRLMFSTFGVPEEIASDGASEFTSSETQNFLKTWQVHHRLSSVAFPHSNCRAEIAVKQVKRIITDNCSPSGSLNIDSFHKAILSYRNTVDPVTKFSPALAVFGRQMRDGLPVLPGHYNPHTTWQEILDHREHAMARRHVAHHEAWSEHTAKLGPLEVGTKVFIQNQVGHKPRRWDKTGVVVECKDFDQYVVKVDGTGRLTLRNRKFLRKLMPIKKHSVPTARKIVLEPLLPPALPRPAQPLPDTQHRVAMGLPPGQQQAAAPSAGQLQDHLGPSHNQPQHTGSSPTMQPPVSSLDGRDTSDSPIPPPISTPTCPGTPKPPAVTSRPPTPTTPRTPQPTIQSPRPQRTRRPNVKYSETEWALDTLVEDSPTLSSKQVVDMLQFIASNMGNKMDSQP